tara:strand:- start:1101 stop:1430 length:330 start_codon:yes stop_codon:yes gene_type:complete
MRFLTIILCLFIFSCDDNSPLEAPILGCMNEAACNYNPIANENDGTCTFVQLGKCDCDGNVLDCSGVCGGDDMPDGCGCWWPPPEDVCGCYEDDGNYQLLYQDENGNCP